MYMNLAPFTMLCYSVLVSSSIMALSSSNWLIFWLSMEINLLSFIPIILTGSGNQETEAAIKYFLAQALGSSAILVFSTSLWNLESFSFSKLFSLILMVSILLKLGSAPCHFWYPSVMSSISWVSCFVLTTWQKLAPLCAISFFLMQKFSSSFLIFVGSLNAIIGGIMGLNQSKMRSIMAYSSIGHIGWMLSLSSIYMPISSVVYFVVYSMLILPLFFILGLLNIYGLNNLNKTISMAPLLIFVVSILFLSLGGLPPLTGFAPKMMTIFLLVNVNSMFILFLILGSVLNLCFYLNIIMNLMLSSNFNLAQNISLNNMKWVNSFFVFSIVSLLFILLLH
uniref:NADH-ubiquinone oxidoreductase chain 2 n=1 Tax=Drawida japonica TaxID=408826 RepID=A0A0N6YQV3_9ANNE|nr:NADH dehydrogenase subunit 2 [Drawida japonica]AIR76355.1 NADH dehydrogenase subunit 2 [Drawida japonica]